jgi:flavorubredoxin
MANAVMEGAKTVQGVELKLEYHVEPEALADFDAIIVGTPTYHHDMTIDMKNLLEEVAVKNINLRGKVGAAFGSYGWSGEAPRLILEVMKNKFEMNVIDPPLLNKYAPDQAGLEKCKELGKKIAEKLMQKT